MRGSLSSYAHGKEMIWLGVTRLGATDADLRIGWIELGFAERVSRLDGGRRSRDGLDSLLKLGSGASQRRVFRSLYVVFFLC